MCILLYCLSRCSKVCCEPTKNTMILKMQWGGYGFTSVSECSQIALLGRRITKALCLSFLRSWAPSLTSPTTTSALAGNLPYLVSTIVRFLINHLTVLTISSCTQAHFFLPHMGRKSLGARQILTKDYNDLALTTEHTKIWWM